MHQEKEKRFLTARELAAVLRVAPATVYQRARRRELPHYKIGDRLVFDLAEVLSSTRVEVPSDGRVGV